MKTVFVILFLFVMGGAIIAYVTYEQVSSPATNVPQSVSGTPVSYTEVVAGNNSTVTTRQDYLISTTIGLAQLWQMTDAATQPPKVDFSANDIIAIFAGSSGTKVSMKIDRIVDTATNRVVIVDITKPGASCIPSPSTAAPYEILQLPKSSLPYTHQDNIITGGCL